ncbi:YkyB family protein [Sporosarcina sp. CAU 1771]
MDSKLSTKEIAIAIYTVNRHAKTAPDNKQLYVLKKMAIDKLLVTGKAEKIGLHFVENPKFSKQHSTTLIRCGEFLFHTIPEKEDFKTLPHLGHQDQTARNPQERMGLKSAKDLLEKYVEFPSLFEKPMEKPKIIKTQRKKTNALKNNNSFRSSYLDG